MQSPEVTSRHKAAQVTPGQQLGPLGCGLLLFFSASPKIKHALKGAWRCNGEGCPSGSWLLFCSHYLSVSHLPGFCGRRADAAGLELR